MISHLTCTKCGADFELHKDGGMIDYYGTFCSKCTLENLEKNQKEFKETMNGEHDTRNT